MLFDTDPGVDDALALLYLQRQPRADIVGITTVAGNGTIDAVTRNALYLAERFNIGAPIARGAARPLYKAFEPPPTAIHGADALGGVNVKGVVRGLDPRPAYELIAQSVRAYPHELTIVAVGMLTNIALAIATDPGIVPLIGNIVAMGGAFGRDGHSGNVRPCAEANIFGDPHAADLVCTAAVPLTLVGLDVTERIVMQTNYLRALADGGSAAGAFIWDVTRGYEAFHAARAGVSGIYAHDPSAAICVFEEAAFTFENGPVRVVTDGIAAGMTVQKPDGRSFPPSAWDGFRARRVAVDVDAQRVLALFANAFA